MARYEKGRKGETRQRIVEIASRRIRAEGIDAVGVASLMSDAGLTSGGFYAHFDSKEDLVREAVVYAFLETSTGAARRMGNKTYDLRTFIADYLSPGHRDHPEAGCAIAALSTEIVRRHTTTIDAFRDEFATIIDRIAAALPLSLQGDDRRARACSVFSHLLGTLQVARLAANSTASMEILEQGKDYALRLAGLEPTEGRRIRSAQKLRT